MIHNRSRAPIGLLLASILLLALAVPGAVFCLREWYALRPVAEEEVELPDPSAAEGEGRRTSLSLYSAYAVLCDLESGEVLYAVQPDTRCYPASLTKMMTVYAALQQIDDLDDTITVRYEDLAGLYEENASMAGLQEGDTIPLRDLLYATMLPSGADAANTLARAASGSVADFIVQMNETAAALGMTQTHFANVTGLTDESHYTTASDMMTLLKTALTDETFRSVICTASYTTVPTSAYPNGIPLTSTLSQKFTMMGLDWGPVLGGKTGYTEEAGLCLASIASISGHEYALVTMGAAGDSYSEQTSLLDALNLYSRCRP
jgi:D-alanyl-D-alanine carboxypeptidase (penicillin-binding protein 5/6)